MTVLVGGVGELYQGDLDFGRHAADRLAKEDLGPSVVVEDLHYGAIAVSQRLEDLRPDTLVLVGAMRRGRTPGTLQRRRLHVDRAPEELQRAVGHAGTGYVDIDLVVDVAFAFGALPGRTVAIEVEPVLPGPADHLSAELEALLDDAVQLARNETRRAALLLLADDLRALPAPDVPAREPLHALLEEIRVTDETGGWGRTFELRDALRDRIARDPAGDALGAEEWALGWALLEEIDRIESGVSTRAAG